VSGGIDERIDLNTAHEKPSKPSGGDSRTRSAPSDRRSSTLRVGRSLVYVIDFDLVCDSRRERESQTRKGA